MTNLNTQPTAITMALSDFNMDLPMNPLLWLTDSYKISHILFETDGVAEIYSNFTARFDKYISRMCGEAWDGKFVVFGIQYLILRLNHYFKVGFFDRDKEEVIQEMKDVLGPYINQEKYDHFERLHDLGYLPVVIKALPEGTLAPVTTPFFTIRNTVPEMEWVPNYLETIISSDLWKQLTVATIGRLFRKISNEFAMQTQGNLLGTEWQNHDFSFRGQPGWENSSISGVAFLLSSCGTDNVSSLYAAKKFYNSTNKQGLLAGSVPASEHSVGTLGILVEQYRAKIRALRDSSQEEIDLIEAERRYTRRNLTERFPTGIFSNIADSFDYWAFVTEIVPSLKPEIMARDGKFVIRGDSGNPVHIIAGYRIQQFTKDYNGDAYESWDDVEVDIGVDGSYPEVVEFNGEYKLVKWDFEHEDELMFKLEDITRAEAIGTIECLWETFGGTVNDLGYRVLDSHIGMIYGDGINLERSQEILTRLKEKKYVSTNIVFGVGSYSLSMLSRDHLGMAIKATNAIVDIECEIVDAPIYKEPKTDSSKKSLRGLIQVIGDEEGNVVGYNDKQSREEEDSGLLQVVYKDGQVIEDKLQTVFQIRERLWGKQ